MNIVTWREAKKKKKNIEVQAGLEERKKKKGGSVQGFEILHSGF